MGELKQFKGGKTNDDEECAWCHKDYECHGRGHTPHNCPRVEAISYLPGSEVHTDGWYIEGVKFRDYTFEVEVEDEE
jgi:hypothetical protein